MANFHVDMGQGILECINDVMHREQMKHELDIQRLATYAEWEES